MVTPAAPPPPPPPPSNREVAISNTILAPSERPTGSDLELLHNALYGERLVRFNPTTNTIDIATSNPTFQYGIPHERCSTPADALQWISHLSHKNWFSAEHAGQLADEILHRNNLAAHP